MNVTATRLAMALNERSMSQSALARGLGITQGAVSKILLGQTANSRHIPRIAAFLGVSSEWLLGETDQTEGPRSVRSDATVGHVMMPVALPPKRALVRMFDVLLEALPPEVSRDEQANLLAEWLPDALSMIRDLLPPILPSLAPELADALVDHDRAT